MNSVLSPRPVMDVHVKSEPLDDTYSQAGMVQVENGGNEDSVTVKLEPVDSEEFESLEQIQTHPSPELRKLLSVPGPRANHVVTRADHVPGEEGLPSWRPRQILPQPSLWEQQVQESIADYKDDQYSTLRQVLINQAAPLSSPSEEQLWSQQLSRARKRTYEDIVADAIRDEFGPGYRENGKDEFGPVFRENGKENHAKEDLVYPASAALMKLCASEGKKSAPVTPSKTNQSESVIRSLLTSPIDLQSHVNDNGMTSQLNSMTSQRNGTSGIADVMKRMQTALPLTPPPKVAKTTNRSPKVGALDSLRESPKVDNSAIRALLTSAMPLAKTPPQRGKEKSKPVLMNLLTEAPVVSPRLSPNPEPVPTTSGSTSSPALPPRGRLDSSSKRTFPSPTPRLGYSSTQTLRALLYQTPVPLVTLDNSSRYADLAHITANTRILDLLNTGGADQTQKLTNDNSWLDAYGINTRVENSGYSLNLVENSAAFERDDVFRDLEMKQEVEDYVEHVNPEPVVDHVLSEPSPEPEVYPCPDCHKTFSEEAQLLEHYAVHEEDDFFMCSECGDEFRKKKALQNHKRKHHKLKISKPTKKNTSHSSKSMVSGNTKISEMVHENGPEIPAQGDERTVDCDVEKAIFIKKDDSWCVDGQGFVVEKNEDYDSDG